MGHYNFELKKKKKKTQSKISLVNRGIKNIFSASLSLNLLLSSCFDIGLGLSIRPKKGKIPN